MTRILTVIGARPQFVKAAVLSRTLRSEPWRDRVEEFLVHTGQHYDENMSEVFFREMEIPKPDANLGVGGGSHGAMTGQMLAGIEALLLERKPDLLLVYGDTNSTLAGALAASKLHIPVAHVEAGLRSWNKGMPEEQNRIVADHLSTWLLCPTETAVRNLTREGITGAGSGRPASAAPSSDIPAVERVGDIMLDASLYYRGRAAARPPAERALVRLGIEAPFRLLTLHRAENTDDSSRLRAILSALGRVDDQPLVFPVHPRTRKVMASLGLEPPRNMRFIEPVGYLDMLELEAACGAIVTDSGGVQKEAYFFGKPCVTLREQTEWVETVEAGWNVLVGAEEGRIEAALRGAGSPAAHPALYGEGEAGTRIAKVLLG